MVNTILIADDDLEICEVIRILLESEGYQVIEVHSGMEVLEHKDEPIDLFILDVMMPGCSGILACQELRKERVAPVLFLTAKSEDTDKVQAFSAGGDDYLVKPFSHIELLSRVRALLRRSQEYNTAVQTKTNQILHVQDLEINLETGSLRRGDEEILMTDLEFQIFVLLASNKNKIFSIQNIYESVWNEPFFSVSNNTVTVHIRNIRKKLEPDAQNPKYIINIWGRGYRIG